MLTASDVEQKTFSTALRGYDLDEVDDFLDEIVATIKGLNEQLEEARAARDGAVVTPIPAPAPEPEPEPELEPTPAPPQAEIDESAIGRALVAAQEAADRLLEDAQSEAGRIVDDARSEADSFSAERDARRREAEAEMAQLAARVAAVRSELAVLASEVSEKLDDMDAVIEAPVSADSSDDQSGEDIDDQGGEHFDNPSHDSGEVSASMELDEDGSVDLPEAAETATGDEASTGSDHLDDILNGVANDLQLGSDHDEEEGESDEDE